MCVCVCAWVCAWVGEGEGGEGEGKGVRRGGGVKGVRDKGRGEVKRMGEDRRARRGREGDCGSMFMIGIYYLIHINMLCLMACM